MSKVINLTVVYMGEPQLATLRHCNWNLDNFPTVTRCHVECIMDSREVASNDIKGFNFFFSFRFFCVVAPGFAGWEHTGSKILAIEGWRNQWWTPHWLTQTALQRSLPSYAFRGTSFHQSFESSLILLASKNDFRAFTMHNYIVIVKWLQIACMLCSVECYSLHCWWPWSLHLTI